VVLAAIGNKLLFTQGLSNNAGLMSLAGGTFDNTANPSTTPAKSPASASSVAAA